jgi:outer membrane receptor protein involved in Fe transport
MSAIENYDARWEWFPRPGAVLSVSGFYKDLKNPIEKQIITFGGGIVGFENRAEAKVYGAEFEARTSWISWMNCWRTSRWDQFLLHPLRGAADRAGEDQRSQLAWTRGQLYDQSEWIANVDFSWDNRGGDDGDAGLQLGGAAHLPRRRGRARMSTSIRRCWWT